MCGKGSSGLDALVRGRRESRYIRVCSVQWGSPYSKGNAWSSGWNTERVEVCFSPPIGWQQLNQSCTMYNDIQVIWFVILMVSNMPIKLTYNKHTKLWSWVHVYTESYTCNYLYACTCIMYLFSEVSTADCCHVDGHSEAKTPRTGLRIRVNAREPQPGTHTMYTYMQVCMCVCAIMYRHNTLKLANLEEFSQP